MIRTISNALAGRKKVKDESIKLKNLLETLSGLEDSVKVRIEYDAETYSKDETLNPHEAMEYLEDHFREYDGARSRRWTIVKHKIYKGKSNEKHYFDLAQRVEKDFDNFGLTRIEDRGKVSYMLPKQ
ncbi:MAG: hypothetical protein WC548_00405 [Candidatus Pacearchaeota archaeon]